MAKKVINAFNGGEVSPNTHARFDSTLYNKSCLKLENFIPMQAGGVERRPATKYLSTLSSTTNVIYPFVFNASNTYNLIFYNTSLFIYADSTLKVSLSTPYLEAELYDLKITQSADVVFIAHPNHAIRKLSRVSDTSWTLEILNFKVPPLLDEDPNKTFSITGSATKGSTITITSNTDLFTTDHIGGKFLIKQLRDDSNSILIGANASGTSAASDYFVSDSINVSMSNWSIETKGTWRGVVTILRSEDGGDTYEEYVRLADTSSEPLEGHDPDTDTTSNKNFTFASTEPEPLGALLKVQYTQPDSSAGTYDDYKDFSFELKADDPYLYGLCLITGRTSGTVATATLETPIAYTISDYSTDWEASTPFNKGEKVTFGGTLTVTNVSATNEFIELRTAGGSSGSSGSVLANVQGMTYGDSKLWVLVTANADGSGTQTVYSYTIANEGLANLEYTYSDNDDLSGITYVRVSDIAYYNSELYVLGVNVAAPASGSNGNPLTEGGNNSLAQGSILRYNTSGVYQSTFHNFPLDNSGTNNEELYGTTFTTGLGFDGTHFYATEQQTVRNVTSSVSNPPKQVKRINRKINTAGSQVNSNELLLAGNPSTGNQGINFGDIYNDTKEFQDWTSIEGKLYALNDTNDRWDTYDTGFGNLSVNLAIGQTVASEMRGTAYNSTTQKLYGIQSNGMIIEFGFLGGSVYYQCTSKHASASTSFATWLAQGYWVQRFPESVTFQEGAYSDHRGYPHSIAIYESRLCFGGTDSNPNTLWLSKSNDLDNFQTGVNATDSMRLTINSNTIDEIRWLCPFSDLIIGTSSNEWSLGSGSDQLAVTPTQLNIKRKSNYGSSKLQGTLVNASVLFFMRQKTKLREWIDQNTKGVFLASDLTSIADHITEGGILQFAVQTQPETIIWAVRNDGTLLGLTYEKETETFGWHRHILGGRSGTATITVTDYANITAGTTLALTKSDGTTVTFTSEAVGASSPSTSLNWRPNTSNDVTADNIFTAINTHADFTVANPAANIVTITETTPATKGFLSIISSDNTRLAVTSETNTVCESVSVLPTSTGEDCVYVIVKKENNERCYVKLDSRNWGTTYTTEYNGLDNYTTASKAVSSQSASFSANELDQFASDTVSVKVNGVLQTGTYTVGSDGSLTVASIKDASGANLTNGTYTIVVGKPYTSTLAPLYIDSSTSYGSKKSIHKATIRFKDTLSAKTGQTETTINSVAFTSNSSLNSEDAEVWLDNANEFLQTVYVVQDEPQPCNVLAMIANVEGT